MRGGLVSQHGDGEGVPGAVSEPRGAGDIRLVRTAGRGAGSVSGDTAPAGVQIGAGAASGIGARKGVAVLSVAVRGKLPSSGEFNPGYPGLLTSGVEDRDTYSYKGVISDCVRGVDFLLSRPEIDADRIYCCGSSQGGGLTLITSALRPEIKAGVAGYPFLCCFPESMRMLRSYPYDELSCYQRAYPDKSGRMLDTLRYFDAVNFAPRIKCPMVVGIAMEDEVCPPETSYAAYRQLGGERALWLFPESGHGNAHEYPARERAWLEERIGLASAQAAAS